MKEKQVVHKVIEDYSLTSCSLHTSCNHIIVSGRWDRVTCKNCLRYRPKRKDKS